MHVNAASSSNWANGKKFTGIVPPAVNDYLGRYLPVCTQMTSFCKSVVSSQYFCLLSYINMGDEKNVYTNQTVFVYPEIWDRIPQRKCKYMTL